MSNIDKQALREAAEKATPGEWWIDSHGMAMVAHQNDNTFIVFVTDGEQMGRAIRHEDTGNLSHWRNDNDASFIAAANPVTVLALLDELEAKDATIAFQQREIRTLLVRLENANRAAAAGKGEAS
ncbi:ead/Ea22-like family protein [Enterobacter bugandensis]|uniref:ead/Ea22-like family protein n=1 Tax=Enterobacter bugandensis TaxID=881260 RepID=UPI001F4A7917|nr:ead/Ea22-like family protein [Enterobacter bugandensis]MCK1125330.1 ead/Ea22-like family protein [Enterobacter bugandensis]HEG2127697.1 ead/Ea22-like family protein [Enterobacter bugandensis]